MDDQAILSLFRQRLDAALAETEAKYGKLCFRTAHNILDDPQDAEECVNDTWLRAWNSMPDARPAALPPFLGVIVRSTAINRFRAARRLAEGGDEGELARLVVMNTASVQLFPATAVALRAAMGSAAPADILPAVWVASALSVSAGLLAERALRR